MRFGPAAAAAAATALVTLPAAAVAAPSLGYNEDLHALQLQGRLGSVLDDIEAEGAETVRLNVYACRATAPGGWEPYDAVVSAIRDRGLHAVVMVGGVPGGSCDRAWEPPRTGREWNAWYGFVAETVRRTWAVADAYEIWNEPNLPAFWPAEVDPAAYATVVAYAEYAVTDAQARVCAEHGECDLDPRTTVAGLGRPALSCRKRGQQAPVCATGYMRETLRYLSPFSVDAVGIHLYPERSYGADNEAAEDEAVAQYDDLDAVVDAAGFGDAARLVTELGFRTRTDPDRCGGLTEAGQAARLTGTWRRLSGKARLETVQVHRFADSRHEVCAAGPYQAYGVMGPEFGPDGFEPKQSYCALAAELDRDPPKC